MWPGVAINHLQPRFGIGSGDGQKQFLAERTMTTALFISYFVYSIWDYGRNLVERTYACKALRNLLARMLSCIGACAFAFQFQGSGNDDQHWTQVRVGVDMRLDVSLLWSPEFMDAYINEAWASDMANGKKPWLVNALALATLDELICFSLDPSHDIVLKSVLLPNVLCLMCQIASLLDENVSALANTTSTPVRSSNKKKFTGLSIMQKRAIGERLFTGKDRG